MSIQNNIVAVSTITRPSITDTDDLSSSQIADLVGYELQIDLLKSKVSDLSLAIDKLRHDTSDNMINLMQSLSKFVETT